MIAKQILQYGTNILTVCACVNAHVCCLYHLIFVNCVLFVHIAMLYLLCMCTLWVLAVHVVHVFYSP